MSRASTIHLADNLALPLDAVTQTFAILGVRGSGKTNTGVVIAEELLEAEQQVVVIDPVDVWWGLKSSRDGKSPALPIPIVGGEHGDVPLEGSGGVVIADFIVDTRTSAILSLRHLSISDQRRFATDFARRLYERKGAAEFRSPVMLVVDEADEFMPQRIPPGYEAMFGAFDRIVRRGRASGLGVTAITQRPQVLNKDILSQMETLVAHRVLHKLDRKALEAWIEAHDTDGRGAEFMKSLASLERGDAWIWSPAWLDVFKRVHVRHRNTFDSSATPKAGQHLAPPKNVAAVDLEQLRAALSETVEKQKADDPRELKRQIAELKRELAKKGVDDTVVESAREFGRQQERHRILALIGAASMPEVTITHDPPPTAKQMAAKPAAAPREAISGPQQRILDSLAEWESIFIPECDNTQIAFLANYSPTSTSYTNPRGELHKAGLIRQAGGAKWTLTDEGRKLANKPADGLTNVAAQARVLARLSGPQRRILEPLLRCYPAAMLSEDLALEADYSPTSTSFTNPRGELRGLGLIDFPQRGMVAATAVLFPEGPSRTHKSTAEVFVK